MSVYSAQADQIAGWLLVSALLALGGMKALHTACVAQRTDAHAQHHITQHDRYNLLYVGILCTIPMLYVCFGFGLNNVVEVLGLMIGAAPLFGWAIAISAILAALHMPLVIFATAYIKLRPAPFAYRYGDQYVPTAGQPKLVSWIRSAYIVTDKKGKERTVLTPGNATYYGELADRSVAR